MFLSQQQATINLRALVLGGIWIGALGVLDDLVIALVSAMFELQAANASFWPACDLPWPAHNGAREPLASPLSIGRSSQVPSGG